MSQASAALLQLVSLTFCHCVQTSVCRFSILIEGAACNTCVLCCRMRSSCLHGQGYFRVSSIRACEDVVTSNCFPSCVVGLGMTVSECITALSHRVLCGASCSHAGYEPDAVMQGTMSTALFRYRLAARWCSTTPR